MHNKETLKKHFETLEVDVDASFSEIKDAYTSLKNLYSTDSIATSPLMQEFSEEKRERIISEIEGAYNALSSLHKEGDLTLTSISSNENMTENAQSAEKKHGGKELKAAREMNNIEIKDVADSTNISKRHLLNIEEENFKELPARIYLKGFIISYAKYLGLDAEKISTDILERYEVWQEAENDGKLE